MTDDELADLLALDLRQAVRPAEDLRARQLHALCITYPGWDITYEDGRWVAMLRRPHTTELKLAGVVREITEVDPGDLFAVLDRQLSLIQVAQVGEWS